MLFRSKKPTFSILIAQGALESIFDECDRYDVDETGGRLLGTYRHERGRYDIQVKGVLEPGPKAERSPTFFLQDGEYQERLFRSIEAGHPNIEHLGNWHTHHVNGYPTLSSGDKATYFNTVNHEKHNTDFFYALLVVGKNPGGNPRYAIKHFLFRRNDDSIYEVPARDVRLVDIPALRPRNHLVVPTVPSRPAPPQVAPDPERAKDQEFFSEFYPSLKPLLSRSSGAPYWKGPLSLVDGSQAEVVALEDADGGGPFYSITTSCKNPIIAAVHAQYHELKFRSARRAVLLLERDLNQALYRGKKG
ncbi:MAG: hypothetical protein ABR929_12855 [Roseiarcus sp.]|jgi:hypothetical protein